MRLHHIGVILGGALLFCTDVGGSYAVACLVATEVTNPCLLMRHIMTTQGKENTLFYNRMEEVFAVSFIFMRTVPAWFMIYNAWGSQMPLIT